MKRVKVFRATAVPGGVVHFWRPSKAGTLCGLTRHGMPRKPRVLPWAEGAWPPECKRCLRSIAALGKEKPHVR
jgi:hypothetical protein